MLLGLDFDNTLVCYDGVFHQVARERDLVPADLPVVKERIRDHLRASGREDDWTELQGYVYGKRMEDAVAFPGALEFLADARAAGLPFVVVSHKTLHPYRGPAYDLHASARGWLERAGLTEDAYFELTKEAKLARIGALGCTHFVDDLPEFLALPEFPAGVERILFDPHRSAAGARAVDSGAVRRVDSWAGLRDALAIPAAR